MVRYDVLPLVFANSQEARSFQYFQLRAAPDLSGYFDSGFFSHLILQVSCAEPAVWHAVIALGSLFRSFEVASFGPRLAVAQDYFAVRHYNQAVRHLVMKMSQKNTESIEVTLMVCLLFICIELLQGNYDKAIGHLKSGLSIMPQNWRTRLNRFDSPNSSITLLAPQSIEVSLLETFSRLHVQAAFLGPASPRPSPVYYHNLYESPSCRCVSSLSDARLGLDSCMHAIFNFEQSCLDYDPLSPGRTVLEQKEWLEFQLQEWYLKFKTLVGHSDLQMSPKDLQGAAILEAYYNTLYIVISASLSKGEMIFDRFFNNYEAILHLSKSLLEPPTPFPPSLRKPGFSLEVGIIPTLFYTATKCRDPWLRREACRLISCSPHQEGIWDRTVVAKLVERTIAIEEEGFPCLFTAKDLPEYSRIRYVGLDLHYGGQRSGTLLYTSLKGNFPEEIRELMTW